MRGLAWLALASVAWGCSTSKPDVIPPEAPPAAPPIDAGDPDGSARTLQDLTEGEREALCDWTAQVGGGYGRTWFCEGGAVVENQHDRSQCLYEFVSGCWGITIDAWAACQRKIATDPCALYMFTADECKPILKCSGKRDGAPPQPDPDAAQE